LQRSVFDGGRLIDEFASDGFGLDERPHAVTPHQHGRTQTRNGTAAFGPRFDLLFSGLLFVVGSAKVLRGRDSPARPDRMSGWNAEGGREEHSQNEKDEGGSAHGERAKNPEQLQCKPLY
jgi:hypothetical protein